MDRAVGWVAAYLELNGYFVLTELPVRVQRSDGHYETRTDLDVLAVRFPHASGSHSTGDQTSEAVLFTMKDPNLQIPDEGMDVILAEVKEGDARLNAAMTHREVLTYALLRAGCCAPARVDHFVRQLQRDGRFERKGDRTAPRCQGRLVTFAGGTTEQLPDRPAIHHLSLRHVAEFMQYHLHRMRDAIGTQEFKDPVLDHFALMEKVIGDD